MSRQSTQCDNEESIIQGSNATIDDTKNGIAATHEDKENDISFFANNGAVPKPATPGLVKISLNPSSRSAN